MRSRDLSLDGSEVEEILSSKKRHHYNRALKEMHELVKLESLRMHWSGSGSEEDPEMERQEDEMPQQFSRKLFYFMGGGGLSSLTIAYKVPFWLAFRVGLRPSLTRCCPSFYPRVFTILPYLNDYLLIYQDKKF